MDSQLAGLHTCGPTVGSAASRFGWLILGLSLMLSALIGGCEANTSQDRLGRTYYIDGAGNWGYGVAEVHHGLRRAGYEGAIINYRWSPTLNPALDQTIGRPAARLRGAKLGKEIGWYLSDYPDNQVNIICLSAGTGVGVWACESLEPPAKVHNLVMLGSSLSSNYDMRKALENISGAVYVYYAPGDLILQGPVRTFGTIDGQMGVDSAGLVGLHPPGMKSGRIVNIPWLPKYERYGWTGAHTDATSEPFVCGYLARHIVPDRQGPAEESTAHTPAPTTAPAAAQAVTYVAEQVALVGGE
jgi:hypothetical protein